MMLLMILAMSMLMVDVWFRLNTSRVLVSLMNFPVTPTPSTFSKVLPYKWEVYCSTNGRCVVGFPFLQGLEARMVQRYKWGGGVLPYKLAVPNRRPHKLRLLRRVPKVFLGLRRECPKTVSCSMHDPVCGCFPVCTVQETLLGHSAQRQQITFSTLLEHFRYFGRF